MDSHVKTKIILVSHFRPNTNFSSCMAAHLSKFWVVVDVSCLCLRVCLWLPFTSLF